MFLKQFNITNMTLSFNIQLDINLKSILIIQQLKKNLSKCWYSNRIYRVILPTHYVCKINIVHQSTKPLY